jgi:hypothetical protein
VKGELAKKEFVYYAIWSDNEHKWGDPHRDFGYEIDMPDIKFKASSMFEACTKVDRFNIRARGRHLEDIYAELKREGAIL